MIKDFHSTYCESKFALHSGKFEGERNILTIWDQRVLKILEKNNSFSGVLD